MARQGTIVGLKMEPEGARRKESPVRFERGQLDLYVWPEKKARTRLEG